MPEFTGIEVSEVIEKIIDVDVSSETLPISSDL